jgi:hypothetical protein
MLDHIGRLTGSGHSLIVALRGLVSQLGELDLILTAASPQATLAREVLIGGRALAAGEGQGSSRLSTTSRGAQQELLDPVREVDNEAAGTSTAPR